MNENELLRQQMWDLVYGLLEPDEVVALHARIKSDPAAARLYAEVRLEADLVAAAAKVEDSSFSVSAPVVSSVLASVGKVQPYATKQPRPREEPARRATSGGMNWLAGIAATALIALLGYGLFAPPATNDQLASKFVFTEVHTPAVMPGGLTSRVTIITRDVDDKAKPAEVFVSLVDAEGREQFRRELETSEAGAADVELPGAAVQLGAKLQVGPQRRDRLQRSGKGATAGTESPVVTANLPVQAQPISAFLAFEKPVYNPGDTARYVRFWVSSFSKELQPSSEGFAAAESTLGKALANNSAPSDRAAELAAVERKGAVITGTLSVPAATTPEAAEPANGGYARPSMRGIGQARALAESAADAAGSAPLAAEGASESLARMKTAQDKLAVAKPQSGNIESGESAKKSAGRMDAGSMKNFGIAPAFPPITIAAGAPIDVELELPAEANSQNLVAVARCQGIVVASEKLSGVPKDAKAGDAGSARRISLSPPPEASGEITVSIYDSSHQPPALVGEQLVYRESLQKWNIAVAGRQQTYAPGEKVRLVLNVTDEAGKADSAALAVRVWNEQLAGESRLEGVQLADRRLPGGSEQAQQFFGAGLSWSRRENQSGEPSAVAAGKEAADVKLTIDGDLAQANRDFDAFAATSLDLAEPYLPQASAATKLADNRVEVEAAYQSARAAADQEAQTQAATLGRICLLAGIGVLLLVGLQALLRLRAEMKVLVPTLALAAASMAFGALWMNPGANIQGYFAQDSSATPSAVRELAQVVPPKAAPEPAIAPPADEPPAENARFGVNEALRFDEAKRGAMPADRASGSRSEASGARELPLGNALATQPAEPKSAPLGEPAAAGSAGAPSAPAAATASPARRALASRSPKQEVEQQLGQKSPATADDQAAPARAAVVPAPPSITPRNRKAAEAKEKDSGIASGGALPGGKLTEPSFRAGGPSRSMSRAPRPDADAEPMIEAPASLYWNPQLTTDEQGRAVIEFTMPEVESSYRVLIDAYGGGRIGSNQVTIVCRKEVSSVP